MMKKHIPSLIIVAAVCLSLLTSNARAQENDKQTRAVQSMQFMLARAELVRLLAAKHLNYLDSQNATAEARLVEDGSEVMAFSLICEDETFEPAMLNRIAAEATLKIALMVETSPVKESITEIMGNLAPEERMTLVADMSSMVLMFRIGRKRGLFDALLTDFGTRRFCTGMKSGITKRYNDLSAFLGDKQ